ncbi:maleate cis-trans isomerase family protein [Pseudonocardia bannensis]|uniref:Maleate isomerase n=1 Tax=Pseudonocardia bannensis TaxID=630973 RepID=A0A848DQE6_9PSEU|nr:aspartate/glutamate racemase family protein [Pseudonocardia bannensis]NMH94611.1 Asp/Glu racemase [Pseudonocardia bannensis]
MRRPSRRIGLIVPSSNTTMETEIPELLRRHEAEHGTGFTFHSSRARLHNVDAESLARMVEDSARCAAEVGDAEVDVLAYACLVAVMAQGTGAHVGIEERLRGALAGGASANAPMVSSAGALVRTFAALGMRRVAVVAPYMPDLTKLVVGYMEHAGVTVADSVSLSVSDNCAVGRLDPADLPRHVAGLDIGDVDGIVLSACVQMPSLPAVQQVEDSTGLPVVTAATATTREILLALGLPAVVPGAGAALGSRTPAAAAEAR